MAIESPRPPKPPIQPNAIRCTLYAVLNMQNKPNFRKPKTNLNSLVTMDYENISNWTLGENKPKQTQRYIKDGSGDGGEDRGWVDFVHRTGPTLA